MADNLVHLERRDDVALLRLDRAPLNPLSTTLLEAIGEACDELRRDASVKAVVVTGNDRALAAGADVSEFTEPDAAPRVTAAFRGAFDALVAIPRPVIAAIEGFALAGGCELALLSDFIVAGETAVFGLPETTLGIFPGIGGTQLLPRVLGAPLAKELIFTGRRLKVDEAKAAGLVNHVVPAGQARAKAEEIATAIAANGPVAVRQAKRAIMGGLDRDLESAINLAIEAYNVTVETEDRLEGVRAFNEKRQPQFKGR